jgi:hypothetical protein
VRIVDSKCMDVPMWNENLLSRLDQISTRSLPDQPLHVIHAVRA